MEISTVEDCIKYRLLRRISPDKEKSMQSLLTADKFMKDSERLKKAGINQYVLVAAYNSMFHASRAILYLDGIQEKSHFALFVYIREKYSDKLPLSIVNLLNVYRVERHEALYGLNSSVSGKEAAASIKDAKQFVDSIKNLLNERKK